MIVHVALRCGPLVQAANQENEARAAALEASFQQLQLERDKYDLPPRWPRAHWVCP